MPASKPRIALCICTFDRYHLLPRAIESVISQTLHGGDVEIIVVDNSPDHDRAENFGHSLGDAPNMTYVVEETIGLSNARNVAAKMAEAPIIAYLDDDAVASPQWAEEILNAFATFGPRTSIVGGRIDPIWGASPPPWLHHSLFGNLSLIDWGGEAARLAAANEWFAGANIAFRVDALRQHGGFATSLGRKGSGATLMSNEDIQLTQSIRASGGLVVYAPRARAGHLVEAKRLTRSWFRKRNAWQAISDFALNPEGRAAQAQREWGRVVSYFNALPPQERAVGGLAYETDDPELFRRQLDAIYTTTMALLAGFEGL